VPVFSTEISDGEQPIRCRIDGSVQPVLFIIELDLGFIDRDVIRVCTVSWL